MIQETIPDFGVTTTTDKYNRKRWSVSCVIENLTSSPKTGVVKIQGLSATGIIVAEHRIYFKKLWGGVPTQHSRKKYFNKNHERITKWKIVAVKVFR